MNKVLFFLFLCILSATTVIAQRPPKRQKCSVDMMPFLSKGIDTTPTRAVADNYYMWPNGETIKVKFMSGGSQLVRDKIIEFAKEWEQYANVKFQFVPDNTPATNMRVRLGSRQNGSGHNSYVGTYCNNIAMNEETMNLDTSDFIDYTYYINDLKARIARKDTSIKEFDWEKFEADIHAKPNTVWALKTMKGTVLHEFGHALGLLHEQSYPGAINWNKADSVYEKYKATQGWDKDMVDAQVFEVSNYFYTNGTSYDPRSIMQYSVDASETLDGFSVPRNDVLSTGDKAIISALYPKGSKVSALEVPKVTITNMTKIEVVTSATKKGISIFPSLNLQTNSKLGQVYFVARLVTEDGYYLKALDEKFSYGGTVAAILKMNLLPNTRVSYNKTTKKNLELFLPYSAIPQLNGQKVTLKFMVVLDDPKNGELRKLMFYSYTQPLSLPR